MWLYVIEYPANVAKNRKRISKKAGFKESKWERERESP